MVFSVGHVIGAQLRPFGDAALAFDASLISSAVDLLRRRGARRVLLTGLGAAEAGGDGWFDPAAPETEAFDGLVICDEQAFAGLMRRLEPLMARDIAIIPANPDWVVARYQRDYDAMDAAWNSAPDANYLARTGQRGHYVEFGTFWGQSFFRAYYRLRHWLNGQFFAFDSFQGISAPLADETAFTGGDFVEGAYFCNQRSFSAIAELTGMDQGRLVVKPGFFSESLVGRDPAEYGLMPKSISMCVIDCDLYEPTKQVLEFVTPLLDDGALIYFDDWRLCRASPKVGERAAALQWLSANPEFELIDFPGAAPLTNASWQHAFFIFQRRS
jgi:hypothetical protein